MSYVTEVRLLNVPLERDYNHTLYFTDKATQEAYFKGKTVSGRTYTDFSYQQKDRVMRVPIGYDDAIMCNYVMYKNKSKWYYAFITDYVYKGDDQTDITIDTDVIQTWLFDYQIKPSFIEREHVDDDTIGLHTYPEGLECGEYIVKNRLNTGLVENSELKIVVGVTETALGTLGDMIKVYNGIYSGVIYYAFKNNTTGWQQLQNFIQSYADSSVTSVDAIQCMFLAPAWLAPTENDDDSSRNDFYVKNSQGVFRGKYYKTKEFVYNNQYYFRPKNNKLFCYPYKYILLSNNCGGSAIYKFEGFKSINVEFLLTGALCPGCSINIRPINYQYDDTSGEHYFIEDLDVGFEHDEECLTLGKYPICNWSSDVYTNWLTQNAVNIGLNIATGVGQTIAGVAVGVATGGAGGAIGAGTAISGITSVVNQLAQIHQMAMTPPQAHGNINTGDVTTASGKNGITLYSMSIKDEYAKIIDEFFNMYGYKCNRVKIPNKAHRTNYWYTKTIDVSITGNIPQGDLQTIKDCYNKGITFWNNASNIKDYSVDNGITS